MSAPVSPQIPDLRPVLTEALQSVFDSMLAMQVAPKDDAAGMPGQAERVIGSIALGGDGITGSLYLQFPDRFAQRMAAAMLGSAPEEPAAESEVNDVISEISNMVGGAVKSKICDAGLYCAMSTPTIVRGTSLAVEDEDPATKKDVFPFACGEHSFVVELHLRFS